jgi:hypothetical protein
MQTAQTNGAPVSDVFISYASADREQAGRLAHAFEALGWSVWWDRKIITGQVFDQAIEHELDTARSVVVLWSPYSIVSEWVRNEAAAAAARGVLLPALIAPVRLPLEFRRKQTADLGNWRGDPQDHGFQALCAGIRHLLGQPPATSNPPPPWPAQLKWSALGALILVAVIGFFTNNARQPPTDTAVTPDARPMTGMASWTTPLTSPAGLADLIVGTYSGDVISDAHGSSRSGVLITVTRLGPDRVRIHSDYTRVGTTDITLQRVDQQVLADGGDSSLIVYLDRQPPAILFNPRLELAYAGTRQ